MDEGDEDDIYAPDESTVPEAAGLSWNGVDRSAGKTLDNGEKDEEEGEEVEAEEEEEESDSVCSGALIAWLCAP